MATKAFQSTAHQRAPRFPAPAGSLAALAQSSSTLTTDFAEAWVLLWQACGGDLTVGSDGGRFSYLPHPASRADAVLHPIGFHPRDEAEWRGATMALAALLFLAGPSANDAVFDHADHVEGR